MVDGTVRRTHTYVEEGQLALTQEVGFSLLALGCSSGLYNLGVPVLGFALRSSLITHAPFARVLPPLPRRSLGTSCALVSPSRGLHPY